MIKSALLVAAFAMIAGVSFGQSSNLKGKAMAAANDCMQSFAYPEGLQTVFSVDEVGTCPDGSPKYAVTISKRGHCPQNPSIQCLVISFPIATVTFDCNENVQSIVCFNQE